MADPTIAADYQAAITDGVNTLPNKQELIDKLYNAITGPDYVAALKDLKDKGLAYEAEQMTQRDLMSLASLDSAKSVEAAQKLRINSLGAEFEALVDDPSMIDVESFAVSTEDAISVVTRIIKMMAGGVRHGAQTTTDLVKYFNEFKGNKTSVTALASVIKQIVIDAKNGKPYNLSSITPAQFEDVMQRTYLPADMQGRVRKFFTTTQKFGVWGTISGSAAMAGFVYRLTQGAWDADSTFLERWGAARDLITFFSVLSHLAKTITGAIDLAIGGPGRDGNAQLVFKALGLDRSLPQVWGKDSFLPNGQTWAQWISSPPEQFGTPGTSVAGSINEPLLPGSLNDNPGNVQAFSDSAGNFWEPYDNSAAQAEAALPEEIRPQAAAAVDHLSGFLEPKPAVIALGGIKRRIVVSAFKVLTTVVDLVGIADIVIGAINIRDAVKSGDVPGIVGNSLNIVGGIGLTGAGAIGTLGLLAEVPATMAAWMAPLFLGGTLFAIAGFSVTMMTQAFKRHNALQKSADEQGDWFSKLSDDGLAYADWGDKLEYLRYAYAWYGNDNPHHDQSYFEFQHAEWLYFKNTQRKDGSSLNRLNEDLHSYTPTTWKSPAELFMEEPGLAGDL
jgi:hypothetical protein